MIPLPANVFEESEHVDVAPGLDLPHHCIQNGVAAGPTNSGTENNITWSTLYADSLKLHYKVGGAFSFCCCCCLIIMQEEEEGTLDKVS